jgi:hypothetical protein
MFNRYRPSPSKTIPFIILFVLAFTYRDVLRSMVLVPLAYIIFVFRLIAGSIEQQTLWMSFVVLSIIIAVINLSMRRKVQPEETAVELKYPTRLQIWIDTVSRNEHSQYFKWNLAQDLSNLFIEAIAFHHNTSMQHVRQQVQAGNIDLPPDIIEYLQISQKPFSYTGLSAHTYGNWLIQIWETIIKQPAPNKNKSPLDLEHEKIVSFLEEYLNLDTKILEGYLPN